MKYFTIVLILLCSSSLYADFGNWYQETRSGSTVSNIKCYDRYRIGINCKRRNEELDNCGHQVSDVGRWFFYKDNILGEFTELSSHKYFIFNESSCELLTFVSSAEFKEETCLQGLEPKLFKRWHNSNWGFFISTGDIGFGMTLIIVKIPILILIAIILVIGLYRTKCDLSHSFTRVTIVVVVIIILRLLLDVFPQSF